jgi:hypothetical protein
MVECCEGVSNGQPLHVVQRNTKAFGEEKIISIMWETAQFIDALTLLGESERENSTLSLASTGVTMQIAAQR